MCFKIFFKKFCCISCLHVNIFYFLSCFFFPLTGGQEFGTGKNHNVNGIFFRILDSRQMFSKLGLALVSFYVDSQKLFTNMPSERLSTCSDLLAPSDSTFS